MAVLKTSALCLTYLNEAVSHGNMIFLFFSGSDIGSGMEVLAVCCAPQQDKMSWRNQLYVCCNAF